MVNFVAHVSPEQRCLSTLNELVTQPVPALVASAMPVKLVFACIGNKKELIGAAHKVQLYLIQKVTQRVLGAKICFHVFGLSCILYQYHGEIPLIPNFCLHSFKIVQLIDSNFLSLRVKDLSTFTPCKCHKSETPESFTFCA